VRFPGTDQSYGQIRWLGPRASCLAFNCAIYVFCAFCQGRAPAFRARRAMRHHRAEKFPRWNCAVNTVSVRSNRRWQSRARKRSAAWRCAAGRRGAGRPRWGSGEAVADAQDVAAAFGTGAPPRSACARMVGITEECAAHGAAAQVVAEAEAAGDDKNGPAVRGDTPGLSIRSEVDCDAQLHKDYGFIVVTRLAPHHHPEDFRSSAATPQSSSEDRCL
jgi:hypothetical protein